METEPLLSFAAEAENMLQSIRGGIMIFAQDGRSRGDLGSSLRSARTLKDSALLLGLTDIANAAQVLEIRIGSSIVSRDQIPHQRANDLLDMLAALGASVGRLRLDSDKFGFDVSNFVDESFDILQIAESADAIELIELDMDDWGSDAAADTSSFEIDAEMLEIFAGEAYELLRNIEISLDTLSRSPDDRDALWEIRRNAHTFKGAAGIVGFKKPSELAHRIEDLLDYLAENEVGPNEAIFGLLTRSTECLKSLTAGENTPQVAEKIAAVYEDFDAVFLQLKNHSVVSAAATVPQAAAEIIPEKAAEDTAVQMARNAAQPRSIVRVSLERLDDLVKIVSDLVVSRSVFKQRLAEFDQQIGELQNSTRRLQSANTTLEMNFEASMLGGVERSYHPSSVLQLNPQPSGFDPLEFDRYTDFHQSTRELTETTSDTFAINTALDVVKGNLESLFEHQRRLIEELQERLMRIRMVAFGALTNRLQRAVRVTCDEELKSAALTIENPEIEIDTQIVDALVEPLMHLLRNAVVHGIESSDTRRILGKPETGNINIRLVNEETHIVVQVADDGRGIAVSSLKEKAFLTGILTQEAANAMSDEEAFELMFVTGLTTAGRLNLSAGRGVGMSIVRESIEARQGTISVESLPQKGTVFTVRMPLPLAVTNVLLVKVNGQDFAVPVKLIRHIGEFAAAEINQRDGQSVLDLASGRFPVRHLSECLGIGTDDSQLDGQVNVLLLETSDMTCALIVDEIIKSEEVIIKHLGKPLESLKGVIGAAILGSGDVVTILDLPFLLKTVKKKQKPVEVAAPKKMRVMIVDDSPTVRFMTSAVVEGAGWMAITAKDGIEAMELLQSGAELPAIILSDVEMPRMDGYGLVSTIRKTAGLSHIPVIFITSRAGEKHRQKAAELGIDEYLTKPFADAELTETVERLTS